MRLGQNEYAHSDNAVERWNALSDHCSNSESALLDMMLEWLDDQEINEFVGWCQDRFYEGGDEEFNPPKDLG